MTKVKFNLQLLLLVSLCLIFGLAALHYGQDYTWDGRDYHFYNGYAFVNQRLTWDFAPVFVQTYLNPLFDVINYYLIIHFSSTFISFFHGALSGLTLFYIYLIGSRLFADHRSRYIYLFFSVLISATCSDNLALLGLITNDSKSTLLTVISIYYCIKAFDDGEENLIIAGAIMGLSTALKLTAACYGIASTVALFYCAWRGNFSYRYLAYFILAAAIGFLLGDGYWMYLLYKNYASPLFPFYNKIFHSPYAPLASYSDPLYFAHDYFIYPYLVGFFKTTTEEHLRDMRFALIYTLGIIFLFQRLISKFKAKNPQAPKWNFLLIWFVVGYLIWFFTFTIFRYALQLEIMSGLIIVYLLDKVTTSSKTKMILLALITISLFATTVKTRFLRAPMQQKLYYAQTPTLPFESVVFLNADAIGYVIPYFQRDAHFVGDTSLVNHDKLNTLVKNNIDKVYVLNIINKKQADNYLQNYLKSSYGLVPTNVCQRFTTNIGDEVEVCATQRG